MAKRISCILLSVLLIASTLVSCGKKDNNEDTGKDSVTTTDNEKTGEAGKINSAVVTIEYPEGLRAVVEGEAAVAFQAYLVSRAYYEKLVSYDLDNFDANEYIELYKKADNTAKIAEKLAANLEKDCELLAEKENSGEVMAQPATMEIVASSFVESREAVLVRNLNKEILTGPLFVKAYAAEKSSAVKWAEDITNQFDKAPTGKKLKTLAEQMGTDVKHVKSMVDMAQDILTGDAYTDQAEFENLWYQRAYEIKAGASTAGFVVAVAASGGVVAGPLVTAISTGGVVCNGVGAVLDIGTAGTIVSTNGEGNDYTVAFEKTASQFAPVNAAFGFAGAAVNVKNIADIAKGKTTLVDGTQIVDDISKNQALWENSGQALVYMGSEIQNYADSGAVLGGSFTRTEEGWEITLKDTVLGTSPEEKKAVENVLTETGISENVATQVAEELAGNADTGKESENETGNAGGNIDDSDTPSFPVDAYIEMWDGFNDEEHPFDADAYIELIEETIDEIEGNSNDADDTDKEDDDEDVEEGVAGSYTMVLSSANAGNDTVAAQVALYDDNSMTVDFGLHKVVVNDDLSTSVDMNTIGEEVHLEGTYEPATGTFTGQGTGSNENPLAESFWNSFETVITFNEDGTATGTMGAGESILGMDISTSISMKKDGGAASSVKGSNETEDESEKKAPDTLTSEDVAGTYPMHGYSTISEEESDVTYVFTAKGPDKLEIKDTSQAGAFEGTYNPDTRIWSYMEAVEGESVTITVKFKKNADGGITANMITTYNGQVWVEASGEKQ